MTTQNPAYWSRHGDTTDAAHDYPALATAPSTDAHGVAVPPDLRYALGHMMITHEAAGARTFTVTLYGYKADTRIELSGAWVAVAGATGWANLGTMAVSASADGSECHLLEAIAGFTRLAGHVTVPVGAPTVWVDFGFSSATVVEG